MLQLRILNREELALALPMDELIPTMRLAFEALAMDRVDAPQRLAISSIKPSGTTLVMAAAIQGLGLASKTISVFDDNASRGKAVVNGLVTALDPTTGEPVGICDGGLLTALRTGALSGAVTDALAHPEASVGALIGCGVQARTQLLAMDSVRDLDEVRIHGLDRHLAGQFVDLMQDQCRARLKVAGSARQALEDADVVSTATNSRLPVLDGSHLKPGCHVNGVGSYTLQMRELDRNTLTDATIYVDQITSALHEAGELVDAESRGLTRHEDWIEIGDLFCAPQKQSPAGARTVFKSVGHAVQDVAAACLAFKNAERLRLGLVVEL